MIVKHLDALPNEYSTTPLLLSEDSQMKSGSKLGFVEPPTSFASANSPS